MCDTNKSFVDRGIFELMDRSLDSRKEWVFEHSIHPSINLSIYHPVADNYRTVSYAFGFKNVVKACK